MWPIWLIRLGTQADEFEEPGGGAEHDADNQAPRGGVEPFIDQPASRAEGDDGGEEGDARRVRKAGLPRFFLVFFPGHELTNFRALGNSSVRHKARPDASDASSRE